MTLTLSELENFIEKFEKKNMKTIKKKDLKKAIRRYWDVATDHAVNSRLKVLKKEGYLKEKEDSPNVLEIKGREEETVDKIFREEEKDKEN